MARVASSVRFMLALIGEGSLILLPSPFLYTFATFCDSLNIVIGGLAITHRVQFLFLGKIVQGLGFLILAFAPTLPIAMIAAATAAAGAPMADLMLLMMIQENFPKDQIGKIYSLRMTIASAGTSLGLIIAGPLFSNLSTPVGIGFCALVMTTLGVLGSYLARTTVSPNRVKGEE